MTGLSNLRLEEGVFGKEPSWLSRIREEAVSSLSRNGFPTTRLEEWRYTNVSPIIRECFTPAFMAQPGTLSKAQIDAIGLEETRDTRLVFLNGVYSKELSSLSKVRDRVRVENLNDAIREDKGALRDQLISTVTNEKGGFAALNTSLMKDGALIHIPRGVVVQDPIHLMYVVSSPQEKIIIQPRNLVIAEAGSRVEFIESYIALTDDLYFTNAITEICVGQNASVRHYKIQEENNRAFHLASTQISQDRDSFYSSLSIAMGGAIARNAMTVLLREEGAECHTNGLYVTKGTQHSDHQIFIHHAVPHCRSRQLYKGILDDQSTGVFSGKILVEKNAQKTDAQQTNKNLLLSETATANTKPQLEIYADDVKCSHGAAVGALDHNALFYLKSRGIGQEEAENLLTRGFANELIDPIGIESLKTKVSCLFHVKLGDHPGGRLVG